MSASDDTSRFSPETTAPQDTTVLGGDEPTGPRRPKPRTRWNSGADVGLLIMRLVLGGTFLAHGCQKLFGLFGGPGIGGFADTLTGYGYRSPQLLSWVTALTEVIGGGLVVLGLFTPLAAAGLLGIMVNTVWLKLGNGFFVAPRNPGGVELDVLLGGLAAGITLTGPGRVALDKGRAWFRHPVASGWVCLLLGAGAGVLCYLLLRT